MFIKNFSASYENGIKIEPLSFQTKMSLLVGTSGVGKTTILNSLCDLKKIIRGSSINGFKWNILINFSGINYQWNGEFSYVDKDVFNEISKDPKNSFMKQILAAMNKQIPENDDGVYLVAEQLLIDDRVLLDRNINATLFKGHHVDIKLPENESTLVALRSELEIKEFISAIKKINMLDNTYLSVEGLNIHHLSPKKKDEDEVSVKDFAHLKNLSWSIEKKLYYCKKNMKSTFTEISNRYKDIFPFVDQIFVKKFIYQESATRYLILIKELHSDNLISGDQLSSGMSKTLMLLCYFYLSNEEIVFLIDEFENGLGVNCLDEIIDLLSSDQYNKNIQFILTSHHPYIINNIDMKQWKVISRNKNVIKSYDPIEDLGLSSSRHEAFLSLINSEIYEEGVTI